MKIILGNEELKEIVQHWAGRKFNQSAEVSIANKKNGIEVTVDMDGHLNNKPFKNISAELAATGCCGAENAALIVPGNEIDAIAEQHN